MRTQDLLAIDYIAREHETDKRLMSLATDYEKKIERIEEDYDKKMHIMATVLIVAVLMLLKEVFA
jgi:tRNA 2-selenouridine synthase SelU